MSRANTKGDQDLFNPNSLFVSEELAKCPVDLSNWKAIANADSRDPWRNALDKIEDDMWYWREFFTTNNTMRRFASMKKGKSQIT